MQFQEPKKRARCFDNAGIEDRNFLVPTLEDITRSISGHDSSSIIEYGSVHIKLMEEHANTSYMGASRLKGLEVFQDSQFKLIHLSKYINVGITVYHLISNIPNTF